MKNPFYKSCLTSKEKREMHRYKRKESTRFFLGIVLFAGVCFLYNLNFEVKLISILSDTSMVDKTASLSILEKRAIKKSIDTLYREHGLSTVYSITYEDLMLPSSNIPTLYLGINPLKKDVLAYIPPAPRETYNHRSAQALFENELKLCLYGDKNYMSSAEYLNKHEISDSATNNAEPSHIYKGSINWGEHIGPCMKNAFIKLEEHISIQ